MVSAVARSYIKLTRVIHRRIDLAIYAALVVAAITLANTGVPHAEARDVAPAAALPALSAALDPCSSVGSDISTGIGSTAGSGIPDTGWTVTSAPGGVPTPSAYPVTAYPGWVAAPANTNWIDPNNTGTFPHSDPIGTYVYEADITVPAGTQAITLEFDFAVDNNVSFEFDGTPIPGSTLTGSGSGNFSALHHVEYTVAVSPGTYPLTATVGTTSGPVGLLVSGTATCVTTPPCSFSGTNISTGIGSTAGSGIPDAIWTVTSAPGGVPLPSAYPVTAYPGWVSPPPAGTNWIDPNNTGTFPHSDPTGTYVFETSFIVPTGTQSVTLNFFYAADNNVVLELDGVALPGGTLTGTGSSNFSTLHHVTKSVGTTAGTTHVLTADVGTPSGPMGLLVSGTATCNTFDAVGGVAERVDVDEPSLAPSPRNREDARPIAFIIGGALTAVVLAFGAAVWRIRAAHATRPM
jgi:hypothetical protein